MVSYTTVSPLPAPLKKQAVCFLRHFPCLTARQRYRPFCPAVSGLSSRTLLRRRLPDRLTELET
ncbi:hypothetical protein ADMFC3_24310 [Geovibrio sp. ADMFC3]